MTTNDKQNYMETLKAEIGKTVRIQNKANCYSEADGFQYNFAGKLEAGDGQGDYYVRVGEDYVAGSMGISFSVKDIYEIDECIYGEKRIILK